MKRFDRDHPIRSIVIMHSSGSSSPGPVIMITLGTAAPAVPDDAHQLGRGTRQPG
jgi:hypothetical protein